jgi:cytochrome d ubiquinol oxidase subunit II
MMDLNILWFILIAVLYTGFFVLEGFDFGVGMLLPFLGKTDNERRMIINTIGPHWDANEVWLITAGGATFAAFPHWYASLFSGFYLALFLLLIALIVRGVGFEFRSKREDPKWRKIWDIAIFVGSVLPALLFGVALSNLTRGLPIDGNMNYFGGLFPLLNLYSILGGLAFIAVFLVHGASFLVLKTEGELKEKAQNAAQKLWIYGVVFAVLYLGYTFIETDLISHKGWVGIIPPVLAAVSLLFAGMSIFKKKDKQAFILTALTIVFVVITIFTILFPRVMISSTDPEFSLTIYNASSTPYTLKVMSIISLIFLPIVLGYQVWTYYVFRKRLTGDVEELEY